MKKYKKAIISFMTGMVMVMNTAVAAACGHTAQNQPNTPPDSEQNQPNTPSGQEPEAQDGKLTERERDVSDAHFELLSDLNFSRGFAVTPFHSNSSGGAKVGYLDYSGKKADGDAVWTLAQWGCRHNIVAESLYTRDGATAEYADKGKRLFVDTSKAGNIALSIKGSEEYPLDEEGRIPERTDPLMNWPHILIEQGVNREIGTVDNVFMEIDYKITQCDRLVDPYYGEPNPELNAAQFQWFITLQDIDPESESYLRTMWFGFSMFDTRAGDFPSGHAGYDGGKEDSTGLFIYMFSLEQAKTLAGCEVSGPSSVVGTDVHVKVDVKKFFRQALKIAKEQGAMKGASVDHLKIGSTNIGWEISGNYDVAVEIRSMNMYSVK